MIYDTVENASRYTGLSEAFETGFAFIKRAMKENLLVGRYELSGGVYANIQEYTTKPAGMYEAHQRYIDIQAVVSGKEEIRCAYLADCAEKTAYDEEKDIAFYTAENSVRLPFQRGSFAVFFPTDAHDPCICTDVPQKVRKIVVKLPVDLQKA